MYNDGPWDRSLSGVHAADRGVKNEMEESENKLSLNSIFATVTISNPDNLQEVIITALLPPLKYLKNSYFGQV